MIGHKILLATGDSTSRVMPIEEDDGKYRIDFDTEFILDPDIVSNTVNKIARETDLANNYIVEVEESVTGDIVYSYEVSSSDSAGLSHCLTRSFPKAKYSILFTSLDSVGLTAIPYNADKSYSKSSNEVSNSIFFYLFIGMLILILVIYISKRFKKAPNPNLISMGKFDFDKINAALILHEQIIELTSKEANLLLLLHKTVNETVERQVILNVVWGDEGDYVGRTLDVFISKLRKKLEEDPSVKIVNVRGVGYKLVMSI